VSRTTVAKWRSRFVKARLDGLSDEPRLGRPRTIKDEHVELVITATLEQEPPGGDTHWSTRSMARSAGMFQSSISRVWRAFGLMPHVVQTRKLSADPQFISKLRRSAHRSVAELETDIRRWVNEWSNNPKPFVWTKGADEILETISAYCERINDSGH